jgi:hypothetical protein
MALHSAAMITALVKDEGSATLLPIVVATATPKGNGPLLIGGLRAELALGQSVLCQHGAYLPFGANSASHFRPDATSSGELNG